MQIETRERPIVLSTWEVRAILAGTMTRFYRIVIPRQSKPRVPPLTLEPWLIDGVQEVDDDELPCWAGTHPEYPTGDKWFSCPFGKADDQLWGRETWAVDAPLDQVRREYEDVMSGVGHGPYYRADKVHEGTGLTWRSSTTMPRWASRLTLQVESVRVARLRDITEEDAAASGMVTWRAMYCSPLLEDELFACAYFELMWNRENSKYPWGSNPFCWCVSFRRVGP